ncbi:MAG: phosphatase PAP2 family protein [Chloroflexota bacterium]
MADVFSSLEGIDGTGAMRHLPLALLGTVLYLSGFLHVKHPIKRWDNASFSWLYGRLSQRPWVLFFQLLWPAGTTPVALLILALLAMQSIRWGIAALIVYLLASALEFLTKRFIHRKRPHSTLPGVVNLQPRVPLDPSFPSGDAFRAWFLAVIIPTTLNTPLSGYAISLSLAALISLGRIALGAHYPTDVLAGTGLGILFAALYSSLI